MHRIRPIDPQGKLLYFVHIPKTAGTSLRKFLDSYFLPQQVYPGELSMYDGITDVDRLAKLEKPSLNHYHLLRGHHSFDYLHPFLRSCTKPIARFTVMRDPLSQLISEYNMALYDPDYPHHVELTQHGELSLDQFLNHPLLPWIARGDRQSYHLIQQTHPEDQLPPKDEWYDRLVETLSKYAVVGLHERLAETIQLLAFVFGWDCPSEVPRLNRSLRNKPPLTPSPSQLERIQEMIQIDTKLYQWVQQTFRADLAEMYRAVGIADANTVTMESAARKISAVSQSRREQTAESAKEFRVLGSGGFGLCHLYREIGCQIQCIGPDPRAELTLQLARPGGCELVLEFATWHSNEAVKSFRLRVNGAGARVKRARIGDRWRFAISVPPAKIRPEDRILHLELLSGPEISGGAHYLGLSSVEVVQQAESFRQQAA